MIYNMLYSYFTPPFRINFLFPAPRFSVRLRLPLTPNLFFLVRLLGKKNKIQRKERRQHTPSDVLVNGRTATETPFTPDSHGDWSAVRR